MSATYILGHGNMTEAGGRAASKTIGSRRVDDVGTQRSRCLRRRRRAYVQCRPWQLRRGVGLQQGRRRPPPPVDLQRRVVGVPVGETPTTRRSRQRTESMGEVGSGIASGGLHAQILYRTIWAEHGPA